MRFQATSASGFPGDFEYFSIFLYYVGHDDAVKAIKYGSHLFMARWPHRGYTLERGRIRINRRARHAHASIP